LKSATASMSSQKTVEKPICIPFYSKLIVGGLAGVIGTSVAFPLDAVKSRLQNDVARRYNGSFLKCFRTVVKEQGFGALYNGLLPNLIGVTPEKGIKLAVNESLREIFTDENGHIPLYKELLAGALAGFCQVSATNPMEICKIRMQLMNDLPVEQRKNLWRVVTEDLGFRGLYKGVVVTWMRDVPFSLIYFPLYANLSKRMADKETGKTSLPHVLLSAASAGAFAAGLLTPMDMVKTRYQAAGADKLYTGILDCFVKTFKAEGFFGMFKGAMPRMMAQAPLFGISLTAFELQKRFMTAQRKKSLERKAMHQ